MLVGENGADDAGARPANNAPESLHLAHQNSDGSPDYHGWPDRYGFLPASQAVFNPTGGPAEDLCVFDATNPPSNCTPASLAQILNEYVPLRDVLAFPPQPITAPLAIEAAHSSFTGIDFAPRSFVRGPVQEGAALYSLEGDFGFSPANASAPAPEVGHEVKLINFAGGWGQPPALNFQRFAHNKTFEEAFPDGIRGFNRADQCAVWPRRLRLCRRLWRGSRFWALRPRCRVQECGRRGAGANPRHRRDLEDLPKIGLRSSRTAHPCFDRGRALRATTSLPIYAIYAIIAIPIH